MKKIIFSLLFACLCIAVSAQKKEIFHITPTIIEQGAEIKINYNPAVNGVPNTTKVKGSLYVYKDFKWQGFDMPLLKTDSGYTATYKVPVGTAMLACRYAIGDSIDRGARFPYAAVVHEPNKKIAPGSFIEWGLLRSKDINGAMSPLVAPESEIAPKVLVELWISKEFQNPTVKKALFYDIAMGLSAYMPKERADSIINKTAERIMAMPDATEKNLLTVEQVYRRILNNMTKADSLKLAITKKYPDGLADRLQQIKAIYVEMDQVKKVTLWNAFVEKYPFSNYTYTDYMDPIIGDKSFFVNALIGVANINFKEHRLNDVIKMVDESPFNMISYFYDHYVDYPFRLPVSPISDKEALILSTAFVKTLTRRLDAASLLDRGIYAPAEWIRKEMKNNVQVFSYHLGLLYGDKKYAEALKFADKFKEYVGYESIPFNKAYAKTLFQLKKTDEAKTYVINAIKADKADPDIIALLKENYIKADGGGKDFETYYQSLRPGNKLASMQKRLMASMIRVLAPNFNLENLTGQKIDLSKQKGKIVVLDFWASWCFPCKAAMPGMQTLVNKYEPASDVSFYFIATLEHSPNYKTLINEFLADKKYNFNVLYDGEDEETKKMGATFNDYARLLKLNGIPQKVVIDQDGLVRWVSDGFNGDLVELTDEVSFIIDQLKKEKNTTR